MVDPITMFRDGGPFMYLILLHIPFHMLLVGVQIAVSKKVNLMPLLWANVIIGIVIGLLGSSMGFILAFQAVAHASAEMKMKMMANGISVGLFTTVGALLGSILTLFLTGVAGSAVATLQRPAAPS